jgi:3-hydroxymyristoyl/3-hydroxydecanoyl-(acyl carrier protein) dehydratase
MSFSFVDRIIEFEPGKRARGVYCVPPSLPAVQQWLLAEATGQLASWVGMAYTDFRRRPVAALAGEVSIATETLRGNELEIEVRVERCDEQAVVYAGSAELDGAPASSMRRCVGPMLPMEDFDDPSAVRQRFERLLGAGVPVVEIPDPWPTLRLQPHAAREPRAARAELIVPVAAPFFDDHFPRRPVFPATLLIQAMSDLAVRLAVEERGGADLILRRARNIKVRSFTLPGQILLLGARLRSLSGDAVVLECEASAEGKRVATVRIEAGPKPADVRRGA